MCFVIRTSMKIDHIMCWHFFLVLAKIFPVYIREAATLGKKMGTGKTDRQGASGFQAMIG